MKGGFSLFSRKRQTNKKNYVKGNNYRRIMHLNAVNKKRNNIIQNVSNGKIPQIPMSSKEYSSNAFMAKDFNKTRSTGELKDIISLINKHNLEVSNKGLIVNDPRGRLNKKLVLPSTLKFRRNNIINALQNRYKTKKNILNNMGSASRNLLNTRRANAKRKQMLNAIPNWR